MEVRRTWGVLERFGASWMFSCGGPEDLPEMPVVALERKMVHHTIKLVGFEPFWARSPDREKWSSGVHGLESRNMKLPCPGAVNLGPGALFLQESSVLAAQESPQFVYCKAFLVPKTVPNGELGGVRGCLAG